MEYFTSKVKKYASTDKNDKHDKHDKHEKPHGDQKPILSEEDEGFLHRIVSAEGTPPPLPERPMSAVSTQGKENKQLKVKDKGKEKDKEKEKEKSHLFSFMSRGKKNEKDGLIPEDNVSPSEALSEEEDLSKVLDDLNLSAANNRAFSISKESQELVGKFTVILKDLINGVPTAYDDLTHLLDSSSGQLSKSYERLPSFMQKLVTSLPDKLTKNLAPELLAVAAETQAFKETGASAAGGFSNAAKSFLKPTSLKDLVTKPGMVASMLRAIMNALKVRWPAFMGTNVLLSLSLFVLLYVFWYCHKRGREVRLEKERMVDSDGRIVEVVDDPLLLEPAEAIAAVTVDRSRESRSPVGLKPEVATSRSKSKSKSRSRSRE